MAATFTLNGVDVLVPGQLIEQFDELGYQTSDFKNIANQFVELRGPDPSYGFFLCTEDSYNNFSQQKLIIRCLGNSRVPVINKKYKVRIEWAKKVGQAASEDRGFRLIKVVDDRYALRGNYVGRRYNYVINYIPPDSPPPVKGVFVYHDSTLKQDVSSKRPYIWEELFDECWKLPGNPTLGKDDVTFPNYVPQDVDFRYVSCRDALEMLCQWTGTGIVFDTEKQQWNLVAVSGQANLSNFDNFLVKNRYLRYKEPGEVIPQTLKAYLAKIDHSENDIEEYHVFSRTPGFSANAQTLDVRVPTTFTSTPETLSDNAAAVDDLVSRCLNRWRQFPSQEKTYQAFLYIPIDGTTEKIVYYQHDMACLTRVHSVCKRDWIIRPKRLEQERYAHVFGTVKQNYAATDPFILVTPVKIICGRLQPGTTQLVAVNRHHQSGNAGDTIDVFQRQDDRYWTTTKTGGGSSKSLVQFELAEDKHTTDFSQLAFLLDDSGNHVIDQTNEEVLIYAGDAWQRFHGYKAYDDPQYGQQFGYRGKAQFVLSDFFGKDLYEIVEMEHQARYVEARTLSKNERGGADTNDKVAVPNDKFWDGRPPKTHEFDNGSTGGSGVNVVDFLDRQNLFPNLDDSEELKLVWDEKAEKYILWYATPDSTGSEHAVVVSDVPGATYTSDIENKEVSIAPGIGECYILLVNDVIIKTEKDPIPCWNLSKTKVRGSWDEPSPIEVVVHRVNGERVAITAFDLRQLPGLLKEYIQVPFKRKDDVKFELGSNECSTQ